MKKTTLIISIMLITLFSAAAQTPELFQLPTDEQQIDIPLNLVIEMFKATDPSQFPAIPQQIPFLGADENINFHINMNDGSETVLGVRLKERKVTEITDQIDDWTLRVDVTEKTLRELMVSENPLDELKSALKSKEIKMKGRTLTKKVKVVFLKMGIGLAGLFS